MKKLSLFAAILSLTFLAACGGGGPANPGTGAAGYSNASFKGNYVFTMSGQCSNACASASVIQSVGYLVADGNGNITSGAWDLNIGGAYIGSPLALTGTYSVNSDGTANMNLNDTVTTDSYVIMLSGTNGGYIVSSDSAWALSGVIEQQSTTAIAAAPSANYVFRAVGLTSGAASWGLVGSMNFTTNAVTVDFNLNGSVFLLQPGVIALTPGIYSATTGRGTLTINPTGLSSLPAMNFVYYVVDANTLELVSTDASVGLQGRAEVSTGALASGNRLAGSFAFMGSGFPVTGVIQVSEGGIFTGDGNGNISSGTIDAVFDSNGETGAALTGTGAVSTVGGVTRDLLTLTASGSGSTYAMTQASLWFSSAGRGFYLSTSTDRVETGTINVQSGTPFNHNATYAFGMNGWVTPSFSATGTVEGLTTNTLFENSSGTVTGYRQLLNLNPTGPGTTTGTGTLSFDSTGTIGSLILNKTLVGTQDFRFYQYSSSNAFVMEADQGVIVSGQMTLQTPQ